MTDRTPAGKLLDVSVVDGVLTISIGVGLLAFAVQAASDVSEWPEDFKIVDPETFAKGIANALLAEEEDGTTPVHRMLDAAAVEALEQGADGCVEGDPNDGLAIAKALMGDND